MILEIYTEILLRINRLLYRNDFDDNPTSSIFAFNLPLGHFEMFLRRKMVVVNLLCFVVGANYFIELHTSPDVISQS